MERWVVVRVVGKGEEFKKRREEFIEEERDC
jgi:hypothetical protein